VKTAPALKATMKKMMFHLNQVFGVSWATSNRREKQKLKAIEKIRIN
jgi:uncharacterized protein (DUF697 family)